MKFIRILFLASTVAVQGQNLPKTTGGTGPYPSYYFEDPSLPDHVIYQPKNSDGLTIPVVVWGNGGCSNDGAGFQAFLGQVASHGVMLIASGPATGGSLTKQTTAKMMTDSIDWIKQAAGKGNYTHVDATRIAAWGQSCGGLEAYSNEANENVGSIGIFDSGQLSQAGSDSVAGKVTKPIFYFIGGSTDIAYANAERDYETLPASTPAWKGNNGKGHINTFPEKDAGAVGIAGSLLSQWILRGNATAAEWFTGTGAKDNGYTDVVYKNLDSIKITPIQ